MISFLQKQGGKTGSESWSDFCFFVAKTRETFIPQAAGLFKHSNTGICAKEAGTKHSSKHKKGLLGRTTH